VAAVNGSAYGGGVEMVMNCDIVVASSDAVFQLPEVRRGVIAAQGGVSAFFGRRTRCALLNIVR